MMKSIKKLRTAARNMAKGSNLENHEECNLLLVIADEIEREIAERYMELPVDADGVPFKMGDEVVIPKCYEGTVVSIEVGDMDTIIGVDGHDGYLRYGISDVHHVKPRTIEDVLDELADEIIRQGHQAGLTAPGIIAKYADELRSMGVGE